MNWVHRRSRNCFLINRRKYIHGEYLDWPVSLLGIYLLFYLFNFPVAWHYKPNMLTLSWTCARRTRICLPLLLRQLCKCCSKIMYTRRIMQGFTMVGLKMAKSIIFDQYRTMIIPAGQTPLCLWSASPKTLYDMQVPYPARPLLAL